MQIEWFSFIDLRDLSHSDLNVQNSFHSTIDTPQRVQGVSKNPDDQTIVHSGELDGL